MELGFDEAGSGEVLLLIHGFPFDRTMWEKQLEGLADMRRVIAVDLPGRGKSDEVETASMDSYADAVAATLDELGAESADIAGLSMGGYVAMALLRKHPQKVRSLVLIDTKPGADAEEAKAGRQKTAEKARTNGTEALVEDLFPKLFAPSTGDEVKNKIKEMFVNTAGETAAKDALAMRDRPDSTSDLQGAGIPILVIHGQDDALMPIDGAREWASAISDAKFVAIPEAGHVSALENPEAVNNAIREFLKESPGN